jgi:hypothetical protein
MSSWSPLECGDLQADVRKMSPRCPQVVLVVAAGDGSAGAYPPESPATYGSSWGDGHLVAYSAPRGAYSVPPSQGRRAVELRDVAWRDESALRYR